MTSAARGAKAQNAALIVRANAAELARSTDPAKAALRVAEKFFDAQSDEDNFDFMDRENGSAGQANKEPRVTRRSPDRAPRLYQTAMAALGG
ncbi:MAG: hypothetical protein JOZ62_05710 [Acidobacteriaceae bacterium]|nr:hypothetical protein [Acidobacteriaceae bacterium]